MTVRARPQLIPVPSRPMLAGVKCAQRGPLYHYCLEVTWEKGDDPLPFLRLVAHWQTVGGGESYIPAVDDHGHVGALR